MQIEKINENLINIRVESSLIATLIQYPKYILLSDFLLPSFFYYQENGCLYWAIEDLVKEGIENIDHLLLTTKLYSNKGIYNVLQKNQIPSIEELIDMSITICKNTTDEYLLLCREVFSLAFKRNFKTVIDKTSNSINSDNLSAIQLKENLNTDLERLDSKFILSTEVRSFGCKMPELWESIENKRQDNGSYGIPSKFPSLNKYYTFEPTEFYVIAARLKHGKSAFLTNESVHMLQLGLGVLYIDSEVSDELFLRRILACISGIDEYKIKTGNNLLYEESQHLRKCNDWLEQAPLYHFYEPTFSKQKIYSYCKSVQNKGHLDVLVKDYLKDHTNGAAEKSNALGEKSDFLKNDIAGHFNIPVLSAVQLNRELNVADSDNIERSVTVLTQCRWKTKDEIQTDGQECGNYRGYVRTNRIGDMMDETEHIDFYFNGACLQINECTQHKTELRY